MSKYYDEGFTVNRKLIKPLFDVVKTTYVGFPNNFRLINKFNRTLVVVTPDWAAIPIERFALLAYPELITLFDSIATATSGSVTEGNIMLEMLNESYSGANYATGNTNGDS